MTWKWSDIERIARHAIVGRMRWWFGSRFWLCSLIVLLLLPAVELTLLLRFDDSPIGGRMAAALAAINVFIAAALFFLAAALTSFGTHSLTHCSGIMKFFSVALPVDAEHLREVAQLYHDTPATPQRRQYIEELVDAPYAFRIFKKYIGRVLVPVVAIPFYLGLSAFCLGVLPQGHLSREGSRSMRLVHALEVLRDFQMGILGGTSTEHIPQQAPEMAPDTADGGQDNRLDIRALQAFEEQRFLLWEVFGILSAVLYVVVVLVLLPLQIGVITNLDRHLKSHRFWRVQLMDWWTAS